MPAPPPPFGFAIPEHLRGSMTSYQPTFREMATDYMRGLFSDDRAGQRKAERLSNVLENVTPFGFATAVDDVKEAVGQGDYATAGMMGAMAMVPGPNPKIKGYHGSPHNYPAERLVRMPDGSEQYLVGTPDMLPDIPPQATVIRDYPLGRMRMDKIGTGEGAQAYGHGLYLAEIEGVARGYRDALAGPKGPPLRENVSLDGVPAWDLFTGTQPDTAKSVALARLAKENGDVNKALEVLSSRGSPISTAAADVLKPFAGKTFYTAPNINGSMYEVNINASPDDFLDWDRPLSEQPEKLKKAFLAAKPEHADWWEKYQNDPEVTGEMVARAFGNVGDGNKVKDMAATQKLREAGIPGIKYLDAGSRGKGDGSRNYVVFDENLIEIVRKYGIAGASAALGYNILDGMDEAQAAQLQQINQSSGW